MKEKNEVHYFEIRDLITQFVSAFDSIVIGRFNEDRENEGSLRVRYVYAPKQRVIHNIVNKAEHITLPVVSVWMTGYSRDNDRVFNKNFGHTINRGMESDVIPQPIPVNVRMSMSIVTRYQSDMDQILANFVPYNNPYIIISWRIPIQFTKQKTELRSEVLWSEDVSIDTPIDMGEAEKHRVVADTSFTIKGWLFKKHNDEPQGNIFVIDNDFYRSSQENIFDVFDESDNLVISAIPQITFNKITRLPLNSESSYRMEGLMFNHVDSVYLSTDNENIFEDPVQEFDDFNAIPLSSFDIMSPNVMIINVPFTHEPGNIKFILENPAGYAISESVEIR